MICGLKATIPIVVKACPELSRSGEWVANYMAECISVVLNAGFKVRAVATHNHSSIVNAFKLLKKKFPPNGCPSTSPLFIQHTQNKNLSFFFDNVHLLKNIRNNLLNSKKFVFPQFSFTCLEQIIASADGYIAWNDFKKIYDEDSTLSSHLRNHTSYLCQHFVLTTANKMLSLALAIFDGTTNAAAKCYIPERSDCTSFLTFIHTWWTIVNSKTPFSANPLANAIVPCDTKLEFLTNFTDWLEMWSQSRAAFCLSKQTFDALINTLRSQAALKAVNHPANYGGLQ